MLRLNRYTVKKIFKKNTQILKFWPIYNNYFNVLTGKNINRQHLKKAVLYK